MIMLRGVILALALLGADTPEGAVRSTWNAAVEGSPRSFLNSLCPRSSEKVLDVCFEYLGHMRNLDRLRLGELFATLRLEAAPAEVEHWDSIAVLEMMISSPGHHHLLNSGDMSVDSVRLVNGAARVSITVALPGFDPLSLHLPVSNTPSGWRTGGLEEIIERILKTTVPACGPDS